MATIYQCMKAGCGYRTTSTTGLKAKRSGCCNSARAFNCPKCRVGQVRQITIPNESNK